MPDYTKNIEGLLKSVSKEAKAVFKATLEVEKQFKWKTERGARKEAIDGIIQKTKDIVK